MQRPLSLTDVAEEKRHSVANNVAASERCRCALEMAYAGKYAEASQALTPIWEGVGSEPRCEGLMPAMIAELYLCVGVIQCALAPKSSREQRGGRRHLRRAARVFGSLGNDARAALCVKELAASFQRAGHFTQARLVAVKALGRKPDLTIEVEASLHLIIANSELSAERFTEALAVLERAYSLFENVNDPRIRGAFHNTHGIALEEVGIRLQIKDYLQRAIIEFTAADYYFEIAHNLAFRARAENNIGFLLSLLGEYAEAYTHVVRAKELAVEAGDQVMVWYFDDTIARALSGEGKLDEAERVIERAVAELERLGAVAELGAAIETRTEIKNRIRALRAEASNVIPFPTSLTALPARYTVTVSDDSLINVGIRAGDDIWICRRATARDGDLIFAVTPDGPTLAYYYSEGERVRLIYAGDDNPEHYYPATSVRVYGVALDR